jgi:hypothetical protein
MALEATIIWRSRNLQDCHRESLVSLERTCLSFESASSYNSPYPDKFRQLKSLQYESYMNHSKVGKDIIIPVCDC